MKRAAGCFAAVALLACAAPVRAAVPCSTAPASGDTTVTLDSGGIKRSALLHVPSGFHAGHRAPLVLALHGYHGNGPQMERYSGFSAIADRDTFVVAYPSSSGTFWNSTAAPDLPDDVAFVRALIATLEHRLCIDGTYVFVAGVSNGGGMAALLGCEDSAQIAAIAPVAGGYAGQPPCHPAHPMSVLEIHGTADQVVPYFGPRRRPTGDRLPPFVNGWVRRDRCGASASSSPIAVRTTLFGFGHCADRVVVEHVRIAGGRHQWPGATPPDPGPPATICASCTVWRFFASLMRKSRR